MKKILRGYERKMTARLIAFRSHCLYEADFCTPGEGPYLRRAGDVSVIPLG